MIFRSKKQRELDAKIRYKHKFTLFPMEFKGNTIWLENVVIIEKWRDSEFYWERYWYVSAVEVYDSAKEAKERYKELEKQTFGE